jgi:phosphatidylglycerophosphatase A
VTGRKLGEIDHGGIVWDEMVAIWLVLLFTPAGLLWQVVAVALFRFFDIAKPPPVRWADRSFKGGFGVMFDDIVAAGYTLLVLAVLVHLLGS